MPGPSQAHSSVITLVRCFVFTPSLSALPLTLLWLVQGFLSLQVQPLEGVDPLWVHVFQDAKSLLLAFLNLLDASAPFWMT